MELLDRYLHAVRYYLPDPQQDDIVKELSENIRSQMEDKAAELGRPLTDAEQEAIIQQHGHPIVVAGRYLPQRYLIGPAVFPYYWFTLKGVLWIAALVYIVVACTIPFAASLVVPSGAGPIPPILKSPAVTLVASGLLTLLSVFGVVTLLFAALDLFQSQLRLFDRWSLREMKTVPLPHVPPQMFGQPAPRAQSIAGLVLGAAFFVCWVALPRFPILWGPADAVLKPGPGWQTLRVATLLFVLAGMVEAGLSLMRPHWKRYLTAFNLGRVAGLLGLYTLLRSADIVVAAKSLPAVDANWVAGIVNAAIVYGILVGLWITLVFYGVTGLRYAGRWIRRNRHLAPSAIA